MLCKFLGEKCIGNFYSVAPRSCFYSVSIQLRCFAFWLLTWSRELPSMPLVSRFGIRTVMSNYWTVLAFIQCMIKIIFENMFWKHHLMITINICCFSSERPRNAQKAVLQALPSRKFSYWLIFRKSIYELNYKLHMFLGDMPSALQSLYVQLFSFFFSKCVSSLLLSRLEGTVSLFHFAVKLLLSTVRRETRLK